MTLQFEGRLTSVALQGSVAMSVLRDRQIKKATRFQPGGPVQPSEEDPVG